MKLLLINSFLHPRGGDTTLFFAEWQGWVTRGVDVIPFAMRHPDNLASEWGARFPSWRSPRAIGEPRVSARSAAAVLRGTWNTEAASALDAVCRQVRPHAAHVHHLPRHLTPAIFPILRRHKVRCVWTLHDHELVCPTGLRYAEGRPCDRCLGGNYSEAIRMRCKDGDRLASVAVAFEKTVHRALRGNVGPHAYVSPSRFLADSLVSDGLPRDSVHHVPNLVAVTSEPGPVGKNVVFAGRLTEEKGIGEVAALARALPAVGVDVFGEGPAAARLAGLHNVRLHGSRPVGEVHAALSTAGVVVVPSRWPENQPYAVTEAQLLSRAVVASAIGGIPELIDDGVDGRLVPPGDAGALVAATRALLDDPAAAARLGAAARERVARTNSASDFFTRMEALLWPDATRIGA